MPVRADDCVHIKLHAINGQVKPLLASQMYYYITYALDKKDNHYTKEQEHNHKNTFLSNKIEGIFFLWV